MAGAGFPVDAYGLTVVEGIVPDQAIFVIHQRIQHMWIAPKPGPHALFGIVGHHARVDPVVAFGRRLSGGVIVI